MDGPAREAVTVLHVDDEEDVLETTAAFLEGEREDLAVRTESDPGAVVDRLAAEPEIDCVVSDYRMPGMDGLELLAAVRESFPDLPFVLFTGQGSEEVASDAISAGVTDYLRKGSGTERYSLLANRIGNAVARRRAEASYREIFEKGTDGVLLHDPETGAIRDVNPRFCELVGYDRETLLSMGVGDFSADDDEYSLAEAKRRIRLAAESGPQVFDWVLLTAAGERIPAEVHLRTTTIGGREQVLATVRDVSERQRTRRRLRTVVEHVPLAVYLKDRDGRYRLANERTAELVGLPRESVLGSTDEELFEPADAERIRGIDGRIVDRREPVSYERRVRLDGEERVLRNDKFPFVDEHDEVIGVVGISEDVTTQREREASLRRQNRRLAEFAGTVSHDLRNPLTVARGHLGMADGDDGDDADHLAAVRDALDRMEVIADDVLALAEAGGAVDDPEPVDCGGVAADAWATAATADATLAVDCDRVVVADRDRLRTLFENLFANAVEHGGDAVAVEVVATPDGFAVVDDGSGIPVADRDSAFAPGYSTANDGTGLGLAIVRDVAEAHGWDVDVTEGDWGGARFEVTGVEFRES